MRYDNSLKTRKYFDRLSHVVITNRIELRE